MIKILLVSHGDLCVGIKETAKLFANDTSNIEAIPFYSQNYDKDPEAELDQYLASISDDDKVIIISDTFTQFAQPLMKKLGWPTLFCNELEVAEDGTIVGFRMRCEKSKYTTVKALQSCGFETIASGDSHNDLGMIEASKAGFLFKSTDAIKAEHPELPAFEEYDELLDAIKGVLD